MIEWRWANAENGEKKNVGILFLGWKTFAVRD
jgi:hypothetical protein